jgi:hypothetical protein
MAQASGTRLRVPSSSGRSQVLADEHTGRILPLIDKAAVELLRQKHHNARSEACGIAFPSKTDAIIANR